MRRAARVACLVLSIALLAACLAGPDSPQDALQVVVEETAYGFEATVVLGSVDLEFGAATFSGRVTNITEVDLTVTEVGTSTPFGVATPEVPFVVASGESVDVSLTFDPDLMGVASAPLEVTIDGVAARFSVTLSGTGTADASDVMKLTIDSTDYASGSSYDVGFVDPSASAAGTDVQIVNMSNGPITVAGTSGAAQGLSLALPGTPVEIAASSSTIASLVFDPTDTGAAAAGIEVSLENGTSSYILNVSGQGNYAPTVRFKTTVSGAALYTEANGEYYSNPLAFDGHITYLKSGSPDQYIYHYGNDGEFWGIDPDFSTGYPHGDPGDPLYASWATNSAFPPDSETSQWGEKVSSPTDVIDVRTQIYYVTGDVDELIANYNYWDEEDDPEGEMLFQWYKSDLPFDTDSYTAIDGESSSWYEIVWPGDDEYYFYVEAIPVASTGVTHGVPIGSAPYLFYPPR